MKKLFLLVVAACVVTSVAAQPQMQPIPSDEALRTGKLGNGMTYYIRHNEKPKGQADFYILHHVGAIQENDSQQGLAHFLEHMAFNGTRNLPDKQLTEYLEKVGVKFGTNLNAATGWDQTTYLIKDVPTSREGIVDSALLILHDWSHFIALEPEEIDSERGVIMEELRTRDGADFRSQIKMLQALGKGSKYERRNLIGYLDGLKSFSHDELRAFYRQWYRPDYQAVIVVGDVDVDAVEAKIKRLMGDIPAPAADASQKEVYTIPDNEQPIISIYTDKEMQGSAIKYFFKHPATPPQFNNTLYGEMFGLVQTFMSSMANARLQEIAMQPDAPFLGARMSSGDVLGIMPTMETTVIMAVTQDGQLARGFDALSTELEKIRRYGFTQGEFERVQNDLMRRAERNYANRNDRTNGEFVQTYLKNYTKNTPMPDAETRWQLDSMLIGNISVEAVNAAAKDLLAPGNEVIAVTAPEKENSSVPTADELLSIRSKAAQAEIEAYEDNTVKVPLIPEETPMKGSPVKTTSVDGQYGTTEWTLENGVKIVVKPTAFKADEVLLSVKSEGGLSVLSDDEYYLGEMMPSVNAMSGAGNFSATELKKQLSGKSVSVSTVADEYFSGMSGISSPKDLETLLQLVYLNFASPRFDENDFNSLIRLLRAQLENARSNPDYLAEKKLIDVFYGHNPRRQMISPEIVDTYRFSDLPKIYGKLYPGADSFTFTFVGNVDPDTLKPLVEKYIGSIPTGRERLTYADDKAYPVTGEVTEDFSVPMQQPKVTVNYVFSGEMPFTLANKMALTFLKQALSSRYLISVREEKGGTYGVHVDTDTDYIPRESYELQISFDTNAEMADELCEIILKEFRDIAQNGPLQQDIDKTREYLVKSWKNGLEENSSWLAYIEQLHGSGLNYIADYEKTLAALSNEDVQKMARKILADGNIVKVVMRPQTQPSK